MTSKSTNIILASKSEIRSTLLKNAGVDFLTREARIDEVSIRSALEQEGAAPADVADALAEYKARKVAMKHPRDLVIGCDQVLEFEGGIISKPTSIDDARKQLMALRGKTHRLVSAVVVYEYGKPVWRKTAKAVLEMTEFSDSYMETYLERNWHSIRYSVGGYKLEEEGVRLFREISGSYFVILGLPLLELLSYLSARGRVDA
jgi:septum formation protein